MSSRSYGLLVLDFAFRKNRKAKEVLRSIVLTGADTYLRGQKHYFEGYVNKQLTTLKKQVSKACDSITNLRTDIGELKLKLQVEKDRYNYLYDRYQHLGRNTATVNQRTYNHLSKLDNHWYYAMKSISEASYNAIEDSQYTKYELNDAQYKYENLVAMLEEKGYFCAEDWLDDVRKDLR
jgi:FtsZ-binding cell division protein ZapB